MVRRPSRARLAAEHAAGAQSHRAGLSVVLLAIFRREPGPAEIPFRGTVSDWVWMRTDWWGILGLIGWAYLTVSLLVTLRWAVVGSG